MGLHKRLGLQMCSPTNIHIQTYISYLTTYTHTYTHTNINTPTTLIIISIIVQQNYNYKTKLYTNYIHTSKQIQLYNQSKEKVM